jgi:hypothetical protein
MKHVLVATLALAGCASHAPQVVPTPAGFYGTSMTMYDRWQGPTARMGGGHTGGTSDSLPPPPVPRQF